MSSIIKLTNLPKKFKENLIKNFFRVLTIIPGGIYIMKKHKGTAFVIFETHSDARLSLWRNKDLVFGVPIVVCSSTNQELNKFLDEEDRIMNVS